MKSGGILVVSLILLEYVVAVYANDTPQKATKLFDGKTLAGWEGNLDVFRVQDGAIVGGSLKKNLKLNEFLCTEREFADFELRLKARLIGEGRNAGVQIRSVRKPNSNEVIGYQADIGESKGDIIWGHLYDEKRRRKVLAGPPQDKIKKIAMLKDWNDYRIRCEGKRVRIWVNDVQMVDYTEPDNSIEQKGVVGLQIHGGPPAEAWYKDITIRELTD